MPIEYFEWRVEANKKYNNLVKVYIKETEKTGILVNITGNTRLIKNILIFEQFL